MLILCCGRSSGLVMFVVCCFVSYVPAVMLGSFCELFRRCAVVRRDCLCSSLSFAPTLLLRCAWDPVVGLCVNSAGTVLHFLCVLGASRVCVSFAALRGVLLEGRGLWGSAGMFAGVMSLCAIIALGFPVVLAVSRWILSLRGTRGGPLLFEFRLPRDSDSCVGRRSDVTDVPSWNVVPLWCFCYSVPKSSCDVFCVCWSLDMSYAVFLRLCVRLALCGGRGKVSECFCVCSVRAGFPRA